MSGRLPIEPGAVRIASWDSLGTILSRIGGFRSSASDLRILCGTVILLPITVRGEYKGDTPVVAAALAFNVLGTVFVTRERPQRDTMAFGRWRSAGMCDRENGRNNQY
jgi:hypothetical protein